MTPVDPSPPLSPDELHALGIEVACARLAEEGFSVASSNADPRLLFQVVARKDGDVFFVAVRTVWHPAAGEIAPAAGAALLAYAASHGGTACIASVSLARDAAALDSDGEGEAARALPVPGAPYAARCRGPKVLPPVRLPPGTEAVPAADPGEAPAVELLARCWNTLDFAALERRLAPEAVLESQSALEPVRGRDAILRHLRRKADAIRGAGERFRVFAETGTLFRIHPARPCVIVSQGERERRSAVLLVTMEGDAIARIDSCTEVPAPVDARGSGAFPR